MLLVMGAAAAGNGGLLMLRARKPEERRAPADEERGRGGLPAALLIFWLPCRPKAQFWVTALHVRGRERDD